MLTASSNEHLKKQDLRLSTANKGQVSERIANSSSPRLNSVELKYEVLTGIFVPGPLWLQKWNWLAYSTNSDGPFCKYFVLFALDCVRKGSHQTTGTFLGSPFRRWKFAAEKFDNHSKASYHKTCALAAENFLKVYTGEQTLRRYRTHTDEHYKHHLTNCSRYATYVCPEIQNEVKKIITEINNVPLTTTHVF
ncbi:hypothetical protein PR048_031298, partial [Dryococelus australis]